jgi:hypothetical protein
MTPELLLGLGLIPSMLFVYAMLTTFYGVNRAYIGISWLPIAFAFVIWLFELAVRFQNLSDEWWRELAATLAWASLVQAALGIALVARSFYRREGVAGLIIATTASASPFLVRFIR